MKAMEFRLGNYCYEGDKLSKITIHSLTEMVKGTERFIKRVPLTDEWWETFGFVWNQKHCFWCKGDFMVTMWSEESCFVNATYHSEESDSTQVPRPKYVHKLQNLYFELRGEELTESGFKLSI